ncbi:ExbD/TolR family protein [Nitrococcus mobilis]|uniref:Biopolymer transport protein ExbD/TolR n=1 Tax=Nitrococcus mobilis Nb-231 TaxID=314278 RepID=A4BMK7_9GAMM|nr:biopolymer transporter ExbD [Nitrococcus mobilis]EAR23545.1 Biopolymer transport protein ExbD/TolR [Nitrococcus mobilis Nb-231]
MNLRPRRRDEPEINLTPLIDVVFLMLIFFMVSTTFIKEANLQVSLPQASVQPVVRPHEPIEVTVNQQGRYFLDDQPLPDNREETLRRVLAQRLSGSDPRMTQLVIRADGRTEHLHIVTALDAASRAGIQRVAIATIPPGR